MSYHPRSVPTDPASSKMSGGQKRRVRSFSMNDSRAVHSRMDVYKVYSGNGVARISEFTELDGIRYPNTKYELTELMGSPSGSKRAKFLMAILKSIQLMMEGTERELNTIISSLETDTILAEENNSIQNFLELHPDFRYYGRVSRHANLSDQVISDCIIQLLHLKLMLLT